ncbi:hypothetical protein SAMN04489707_1001175 [Paenacidovorax caeni]|uniref:Uncharacterized protein n=1 Tax=Paenacidovorax caeni TaxID=343013 RepID=A0A1I7F4W8_9BURK|nr:hypothetical protein [Paenacidovorax caeni]OJX35040.1 MAG: hypothetical protein BGO75_12695 [Burkholderiales bacterium 68-20]SFU31237.1 hypothetical protein SAMN04489707_1001175 [Paenacidovorax caeni]
MKTPLCPSCKAVLPKLPQRKTKCKACGEYMFVKSTPDNREKRLMTQAQADAAEQAWTDRYEREKVETRAQLMQPALAGDRNAVLRMIANSQDPEELERWWLLLIEIDLAKLARQGVRTVQLTAGKARDRLCPVCRALDQSIIGVGAGARAVMPENCTCSTKGLLSVSGWIKQPNGSGYVDMSAGSTRSVPPRQMPHRNEERAGVSWRFTLVVFGMLFALLAVAGMLR